MKILHVIPSVAPCRGGPSEAVLAMARSQIQMGLAAQVVTTNDDGAGLLDVPTGHFVDYRKVPVCFLPRLTPPIAALREFQYGIGFTGWMKRHIDEFDLLHVHSLFSSLSTQAMQLARISSKPYLARPLGQLHPWSLQQSALKKRIYLALIERANLSGASAIHCTSDQEADHVKELLPYSKTLVIPHGVETTPLISNASTLLRESLGLPSSIPVILFLSRWHHKKNIPLLLQALAKIRHEPWSLILAGNTNEPMLEHEIRERCLELQLQDRVVFPGHVTGEQKALLLQGADLFALPSASENFGLAVAEALVHGMPVLITPEVDIAETVRRLEGGMITDANVDAWSNALHLMLQKQDENSQARRDKLSQAARKEFSWQANAKALGAAYSSLTGTSSL